MLTRWNPFELNHGTNGSPFAFDRLFKEALSDIAGPARWEAVQAIAPADICETTDAFVLKIDLPGHDPKLLDLKVEGDTLTVRSERKQEKTDGQKVLRAERMYGVYARSFVLPSSVDASRAEAAFEDGVLTITVPKREEVKPRSIEIKVR